MRAYRAAGLFALLGCTSELPDVALEAFACADDTPLMDGEPPCPETHWCGPIPNTDPETGCLPRMGCRPNGTPMPGCPSADQGEGEQRCNLPPESLEPRSGTAAVVCEPGLHTISSTVPIEPGCECPEATYCVALANDLEAASSAFALFLLPPGAALPVGELGITDDEAPRLCVPVCSSELDCPPNHTCRAAAVVTAALRAEPQSHRHTVGACYPDVLPTSSTAVVQPDPEACVSRLDCTRERGRKVGACQAQITLIPDHPTVKAGQAWTLDRDPRALLPRCIGPAPAGLAQDGVGCTDGAGCASGACFEGFCRRLCDPDEDPCACTVEIVERRSSIDGQDVRLFDRLGLCPPR